MEIFTSAGVSEDFRAATVGFDGAVERSFSFFQCLREIIRF